MYDACIDLNGDTHSQQMNPKSGIMPSPFAQRRQLVGLVLVLGSLLFAFPSMREVIRKPTRFIPGSQGAKDIKPPLHRQTHTHNTSCPDGVVWELEHGHAQAYYAKNSQQHDVSQSHTSHFTPRTIHCQPGIITADSEEGSDRMSTGGAGELLHLLQAEKRQPTSRAQVQCDFDFNFHQPPKMLRS